ncbi:hypothetical protein P8452_35530 [Trifolium repens]|nr:hypothetical protein P8452_35530 [Trifolium repens]
MPCISDKSKIDIKVLQRKSTKKIIVAESNGDFVDFIFSFLTISLGSIVKLLGANSFAGCVGNLYKSVEILDPSSVLLNPGIAPQFGCPNQPLNIPHVLPPPTTYYYGLKRKRGHYDFNKEKRVVSKSSASIVNPRVLISLDPRPLNMSREGVVGFVKRAAFYAVYDDLKVNYVLDYFSLSYLKRQKFPLGDLEVKLITIGEAEALRFLGALSTSKFTLNSVLGDILNVPTQESTSASN